MLIGPKDSIENAIVDMEKVRYFIVREGGTGLGVIELNWGNEPGSIIWFENFDAAIKAYELLKFHVMAGERYVEISHFMRFPDEVFPEKFKEDN